MSFWYDYVKPKYREKVKFCYMDTESFTVYIKTDDIYKDIAEDIETRFDTSKCELDTSLPKAKNKKAIWRMKNELGVKFITKFVGLRAKIWNSYLIENGSEDKGKSSKKCVIKKIEVKWLRKQ